MCLNSPKTSNPVFAEQGATSPATCFTCRRLNATTFVIVEDDKWHETPFIYAKVYDNVIILIDTGCGGASKDPDVQLKSLRKYIETLPIAENGEKPLNPGGEKGYIVICTHCHFDHIGGIEQFTDSPKSEIWASGYEKNFVGDAKLLPTHALCEFIGIDTPQYKVSHWATDAERVKYGEDGIDLDLVIYHTPGHTPDELAIYDAQERVLFVGDTAYEWVPIIFPLEGSVVAYKATLEKLLSLVRSWDMEYDNTDATIEASSEQKASGGEANQLVKLASGHVTSDTEAEPFLKQVYDFLCKVQRGEAESRDWKVDRGEQDWMYERSDGRISFGGPKKRFLEFLESH